LNTYELFDFNFIIEIDNLGFLTLQYLRDHYLAR